MSQTDRVSDQQDIRDVLGGRQEAFEGLVRRHEVRVRGLCLSLLRDPSEAEDAAQEVFLKAYRSLNTFREEAAFSTWLHRIAVRHCLDRQRSQQRRRAESLDALLEKGMDPADQGRPAAPDMDLARALEGLSSEYRTVLLLREGHGFTYEEIAQATRVSLDSVKARLRRARGALREAARHFLPAAAVQQGDQ